MNCDHCPLKDTTAVASCPGGRYCELTDATHEAYDERYVRVLLVKAGLAERVIPARAPMPERPPWMADAPPEATAAAQRALEAVQATTPEQRHAEYVETQRLSTLVNGCPDRGCKTGCGQAQCLAGRGDMAEGSIASYPHCLRCVQGHNGPVPLAVALREWCDAVPTGEAIGRDALNAWFYDQPGSSAKSAGGEGHTR